jgi:methyl acetate hydrolase
MEVPPVRKGIGVLSALLILVACSPRAPLRDAADLDRILRTAVEQKLVPGIVAMAATADGAAYEGAFGLDKDTIFAIASMTKPITSVAVMQLIEAGKVRLDEPVATYLSEFGKIRILEDGAPRAPKSAVTVRHLLTHTSGFGYEFMNATLHGYVAQGKAPSMMTGGDGFLQSPLLFDPGTRWEYGISTDWLGTLVERMTGQSLETYFRLKIFEPLGMRDSFFNVPADKQPRLAPLFRRTEDGGLIQEKPRPPEPVKFFEGGGGLYSTAGDYLKFARAILAGGQLGNQRILKPETVAQMGQNQIGIFTLRPFSSVMPELLRDGFSLPGGLDKFGFGFALNSRALDNGRGANTMSWAGINNTFFWIDREKKVCAVLMSQMLPFGDAGPAKLGEDFDRAVYAWLK